MDVTIAGVGPGSTALLTGEVREALDAAELIIGAKRLVEPFLGGAQRVIAEYRPKEVRRILEQETAERVVLVVSGDAGLYSGASAMLEELQDYEPRCLPGISSVSLFSSRLGIPYTDARIVSAHGRSLNIVSEVRRNHRLYVLTGPEPERLLRRLKEYGLGDVQAAVGQGLSTPEEKIHRGTAAGLSEEHFDSLSVLFIQNDRFDASIPVGIDDERFLRGSVPMTKREVRSVIQSLLGVRPDSIVYDIGAGTGSVSVECALAAYRGRVFAVERSREGCELIQNNARRFSVDNLQIVSGEAPAALKELPSPDAVFIGGSGGQLGEIMKTLSAKIQTNPVRVVIAAVTVQTLSAAEQILTDAAAESIRYTQITAARSRHVGRYDLMTGYNPVTLISCNLDSGQAGRGEKIF